MSFPRKRESIPFDTLNFIFALSMLLPSKYENINQNPIVIGYHILTLLKERPYNIEKLFQQLRDKYSINLDQYYNALTFLWMSEIITVTEYQINLIKSNDTQETLYYT